MHPGAPRAPRNTTWVMLVIAAGWCWSCEKPPEKPIRIDGSSTVFPLTKAVAGLSRGVNRLSGLDADELHHRAIPGSRTAMRPPARSLTTTPTSQRRTCELLREAAQMSCDLGGVFFGDEVVHPGALTPRPHDPSGAQHPQVSGDGGLRTLQRLFDVAHAQLLPHEQGDDTHTRFIPQDLEQLRQTLHLTAIDATAAAAAPGNSIRRRRGPLRQSTRRLHPEGPA